MSTPAIITLIIAVAIAVVVIIVLYVLGKKQQKKRDEQQAEIDAAAQSVSMLIIDKKKMKLKESGLPQAVIDNTPKRYRGMKVPVVKAKVGPMIQLFIADDQIFDEIPVKKEVKATVSGLYLTSVKGLHGKIAKVEKKKGFLARLFGEK